MEPKYPGVKVNLSSQNGNAYVLLGLVSQSLRRAKVGKQELDTFTAEATSGSYDNLLQTCMRWVEVE